MNCSLFVVFHSRLHEEQYLGKERMFSYAKVGDGAVQVNSTIISDRIVEHTKLPVVDRRGKHWAESEFLISMYKTLKSFPDYNGGTKWIGFLQYDHTTTSRSGIDLVGYLKQNLEGTSESVAISFAPINLRMEVYQNNIAMDLSDPQKLQGDPLCYLQMIADYNQFYGTNHTYAEFIKNNESIALCSSFVMSTANFMRMMEFCVWAADKNELDQFDITRKHRIAGGLMERYYGCWMALSGINLIKMPLGELNRL